MRTNIVIDDSAGDNGGARAVATGAAVILDAPLLNVTPTPVTVTLPVPPEALPAPVSAVPPQLTHSARYADLAVMTRPTDEGGDSRHDLIEGVDVLLRVPEVVELVAQAKAQSIGKAAHLLDAEPLTIEDRKSVV